MISCLIYNDIAVLGAKADWGQITAQAMVGGWSTKGSMSADCLNYAIATQAKSNL